VYSVCSLEPEEGEDVVSRFLARHPDFRLGDPRLALPTSAHPLLVPPGYLVTSPVLGDVDGFFAARLERRA
jgi:16S rRNA (cytosine967-C5)-methyltransferase